MRPTGSGTRLRQLLAILAAVVSAAGCTYLADESTTDPSPALETAAGSSAATTLPSDQIDVVLFDVSELVKEVRPGVVTVTRTEISVGLFGGASEQESGTGTGIVFDEDGLILTNFHVIADAERVFVIAEDGSPRPARVVGGFAGTDLAILEVGDTTGLAPLPLGSSDEVEVGDPVIAIGNALGLDETQPTVSVGIISAKGRSLPTNTGVQLEGLLQTDAAINSGNSGGPLLNARGEVIGVNTAIIQSAQNIGFSIPIEQASDLISSTLSGSGRPFVGVNYQENSAELAERFGLATADGVIVFGVLPTSPADEAGIGVGDVIVEIDGVPIGQDAGFSEIVGGLDIGSTHDVVIVRGRQAFSTEITIAER
jgi:S1-C subfamily serine protease